jgi:hypothetical protein
MKSGSERLLPVSALGTPTAPLARFGSRNLPRQTGDTLNRGVAAHRVEARRVGMVARSARRTVFTDSGLLKTWATSGSRSTATDPLRIRPANRFGLASP